MLGQRGQDLAEVLRGVCSVLSAAIRMQEEHCRLLWDNSSARALAEDAAARLGQGLGCSLSQEKLMKNVTETFQRASMVVEGVKQYANYSAGRSTPPENKLSPEQQFMKATGIDLKASFGDSQEGEPASAVGTKSSFAQQEVKHSVSIVVLGGESVLHATNTSATSGEGTGATVCTNSSQARSAHADELQGATHQLQATAQTTTVPLQQAVGSIKPDVKFKSKQKQTLSTSAKQRSVPASRLGRFMSFGGLAAGLGAGAVAELARRSLGMKQGKASVSEALDTAFLSEANAERIVNTLCKVRGAALKIGQLLSIQDNTIISPGLQKAFERVRQSADFMPVWQVERVLSSELGADWRSKVGQIEMKPFAAASIGQVHLVTLLDGREAAMKIQYPGVARSIKSDIDNLVGILKVWKVFPDALFIDNIVAVAKKELAWEVDYKREFECSKKFKKLLEDCPQYFVPEVIEELSTQQVFTSELIDGMPVDKCVDLDEVTRIHIARLIMELCLKELFEFLYMQTDPNWSNFFYNPDTNQLSLLDFGASREFSKEFMDQYIEIIRAAADGDRDKVLSISKDIGFLTGYESKIMNEAHVDTVMVLGEVFRSQHGFDFGAQSTTRQVQRLVPTMLQHRLCPPPEEIYSLHRKLSGVFLLCAKLNVTMECRSMFDEAYVRYHARL